MNSASVGASYNLVTSAWMPAARSLTMACIALSESPHALKKFAAPDRPDMPRTASQRPLTSAASDSSLETLPASAPSTMPVIGVPSDDSAAAREQPDLL